LGSVDYLKEVLLETAKTINADDIETCKTGRVGSAVHARKTAAATGKRLALATAGYVALL
jgi:hypothetical protein